MNAGTLLAGMLISSPVCGLRPLRAAVDAVFSSIQASLAKGEKVQLIGFGNFEVRQRAARKGRNPQITRVLNSRLRMLILSGPKLTK